MKYDFKFNLKVPVGASLYDYYNSIFFQLVDIASKENVFEIHAAENLLKFFALAPITTEYKIANEIQNEINATWSYELGRYKGRLAVRISKKLGPDEVKIGNKTGIIK